MKEVLEKVEASIDELVKEGISPDNLDDLGKLIDIHKDIKKEEKWKSEVEKMRYGYRESYNGGRRRDSRGRYMNSGSYDRGYRGQEMIDEMYEAYNGYSEGREEYGRSGSYGAKEDTLKSLEYMMQSAYDFICMLKDEAETPEEMQIIKKYAKKISEM